MNGRGMKKPPAMCTAGFARMFNQISKAALIDALWCASQLGTNDEFEQYESQAARSVVVALTERGDRVPEDIAIAAKRRIDSDGPEE